MAKRSVLICDRHEAQGVERFAVERVALVTLTGGTHRTDACGECYEELMQALPKWLTEGVKVLKPGRRQRALPASPKEGRKHGSSRRRKVLHPTPTSDREARTQNKTRPSNQRWVKCGHCDMFVTYNNKTSHAQKKNHPKARKYAEV